jgi:hypothetical protein
MAAVATAAATTVAATTTAVESATTMESAAEAAAVKAAETNIRAITVVARAIVIVAVIAVAAVRVIIAAIGIAHRIRAGAIRGSIVTRTADSYANDDTRIRRRRRCGSGSSQHHGTECEFCKVFHDRSPLFLPID